MNYFAIFIGGGLGSLARFGISKLTAGYLGTFPLATFLSNIISSLILGVFIGLATTNSNTMMRYFIAIGFCGGFSTFSTFSAENFEMLKQGNVTQAFFNIAINVCICLVCIWLGLILFGKKIN